MARDLVIVCAGDESLHPRYLDGRQFDLWIVYYGTRDAVFTAYEGHADRVFRQRGLKWELVRSLIDLHLSGERSPFEAYRYVFVPDDDIDFAKGATGIHDLFAAAEATEADMGQPAIANGNVSKGWESTRRVPDMQCHATNIVEIMAPLYTGTVFRDFLLPTLGALDFLRAGWGLQVLIAKAAEIGLRRPIRSFVFDAAPMIHTRPVGGNSVIHDIGKDEMSMTVGAFSNQIRTYGYFTSYASARGFAFPFVRDSTDRAALEAALDRVRRSRTLRESLPP